MTLKSASGVASLSRSFWSVAKQSGGSQAFVFAADQSGQRFNCGSKTVSLALMRRAGSKVQQDDRERLYEAERERERQREAEREQERQRQIERERRHEAEKTRMEREHEERMRKLCEDWHKKRGDLWRTVWEEDLKRNEEREEREPAGVNARKYEYEAFLRRQARLDRKLSK